MDMGICVSVSDGWEGVRHTGLRPLTQNRHWRIASNCIKLLRRDMIGHAMEHVVLELLLPPLGVIEHEGPMVVVFPGWHIKG